jgi:hypothetical protein
MTGNRFTAVPDEELTPRQAADRARRKARDDRNKAYIEARHLVTQDTLHRRGTKRTRRPARGKAMDATIEAGARLMERHPDLALRIIAVRLMIEHRQIDIVEIMAATGKSYEWVMKGIRPQSVDLTNKKYKAGGNSLTPSAMHNRLDELESAITLITAERGGVYAACGCSSAAVAELITELSQPARNSDRDAWA